MKLSGLPLLLKDYLRQHGDWVAKNELCARQWKYADGSGRAYGADLVSRKLRNFEEASVLAVKHVEGHSHYKYIPDYLRQLYVPVSQRTDGAAMWKDGAEVQRLQTTYQHLTTAA